jgi:TolB protein
MRRAVLVLFVVVAMVLAAAVVGAAWWLRAYEDAPELLVQRANGQLILVDASGRHRSLAAGPESMTRILAHAAPAPDGRSVAYVETLHGEDAVRSSLVVQGINGEPRVLFSSLKNRPFYLYWAPDSARLAFLTSDGRGMMLRVVNVDGAPNVREIMPGQPSYFSWAPDGKRLLLHTGGGAPIGTISLWDGTDLQPRTWEVQPSIFQAPDWLADGQTALVAITDGANAALASLDDEGRVVRRLALARSGILFATAPSRTSVAYMAVGTRGAGHLRLVDASGSGDREVVGAPVLAFWWSPDSSKLAFLTTRPRGTDRSVGWLRQEQPVLHWNVLDVATGQSRTLARFEPSAAFLNLLPFFDQYAQSMRLWDRAGRRLVYADRGGVWTLDVVTGETRQIDVGVLGMWMD